MTKRTGVRQTLVTPGVADAHLYRPVRAKLTRGVEYRPEELQLSVRVSYDHPRCDGVVPGGNIRPG
jgi:hypothetical protein